MHVSKIRYDGESRKNLGTKPALKHEKPPFDDSLPIRTRN